VLLVIKDCFSLQLNTVVLLLFYDVVSICSSTIYPNNVSAIDGKGPFQFYLYMVFILPNLNPTRNSDLVAFQTQNLRLANVAAL